MAMESGTQTPPDGLGEVPFHLANIVTLVCDCPGNCRRLTGMNGSFLSVVVDQLPDLAACMLVSWDETLWPYFYRRSFGDLLQHFGVVVPPSCDVEMYVFAFRGHVELLPFAESELRRVCVVCEYPSHTAHIGLILGKDDHQYSTVAVEGPMLGYLVGIAGASVLELLLRTFTYLSLTGDGPLTEGFRDTVTASDVE